MQTINRFDDIAHIPLRVYNRLVMAHNLLEDGGEVASRAYLDSFNEKERRQMLLMNAFVQKKGAEAAKKFVTEGLEPSCEEEVSD